MNNKTDWITDVIRYSLLWIFGLGIVTVIVAPIYEYLVETIGGWVYTSFILLGVLTKVYFVKMKAYEEGNK